MLFPPPIHHSHSKKILSVVVKSSSDLCLYIYIYIYILYIIYIYIVITAPHCIHMTYNQTATIFHVPIQNPIWSDMSERGKFCLQRCVFRYVINNSHFVLLNEIINMNKMDCGCQRCHKECATRTCLDTYCCWKSQTQIMYATMVSRLYWDTNHQESENDSFNFHFIFFWKRSFVDCLMIDVSTAVMVRCAERRLPGHTGVVLGCICETKVQ